MNSKIDIRSAHLCRNVIPLIFTSEHDDKLPFFKGTGFFVAIKEYKGVAFIVTAHHCIPKVDDVKFIFTYPIDENDRNKGNIIYSDCIDVNEELAFLYSDFSIIIVREELNSYFELILRRCFSVSCSHDSCYTYFMSVIASKRRCYVIGCPECSKQIYDYDNFCAIVEHRKFSGDICRDNNKFMLINCDWDVDSSFAGFSGSPVIDMEFGLPVGLVKTGSNNIIHFTPFWFVVKVINDYIFSECNIIRQCCK